MKLFRIAALKAFFWCLCFVAMDNQAVAQGSPPLGNANYPSRSAASAACQTDLPWAISYNNLNPPKWFLTGATCVDYQYSSTTRVFLPWLNYHYVALNPDQNSGDTNSNVPVYAWYATIYNCSQAGRPSNAPCVPYTPLKNEGCNCDRKGNSTNKGDPINVATGNRYESADDASFDDLVIRRFYNSDGQSRGSHMGAMWLHSFDRSIVYTTAISATLAVVQRPDGSELTFNKVSGVWVPDGDVDDSLIELDDSQGKLAGWTLHIASTHQYEIYSNVGSLLSISDGSHTLITLGYTVGTELSSTGTVLPAALLRTLTDDMGRVATFGYDAGLRVVSITLPDGGVVGYSYNAANYLITVTYPDKSTRQYLYDETGLGTGSSSTTGRLTGILDESGSRYATFGYQADGRAISTQLGTGAGAYAVSYASNGMSAQVTYPTGNVATLSFDNTLGTMRVQGTSEPCGASCGETAQTQTFDANGSPLLAMDFNGNQTATTYNTFGLLTHKVESQGQTTQRTTNMSWDTALRVPLTRTVLDNNGNTVASESWIYNTFGQATARCEADPTVAGATSYTCGSSTNAPTGVRQWRYTYCNAVDSTQCPLIGLLLSVDGPRANVSDITNYSYYLSTDESGCGTAGGTCHRAGDVYRVTNALGQTTTFVAYDKNGRVARQSNTNGIITDLTYSPRGWLLTRTVRANADGSASSGDAVTTMSYTAYGSVASIQDADGVTVNYTYDAAHRLTKITDALGNYVQYTLNAAGNKTAEQTYDSSGTLRRSLSRTYNTLGQLTQVTDGLSHAVFNAAYTDSYDANGNLVHTADALGVQRKQGYDGLNRLITTIDNYNGTDTATQNTQSAFAYDANDRLEGVSDPDGLNTTYSYDGLGNATGVQSPDTGSTAYYVYDAAGNVTQRTDAKGVVSNSTYDALNRRTATTYADGTLNVAYAYDEANSVTGCPASYPVGRLTRIIETAVTTVYCYDAHGNVTRKSQTQGTVTDVTTYGYTLADRLASTLTPAGTSIQYSRDAAGRISGVTALPPGTSGAGAGNVVTAISYLPFGPIASYTLGNGQTITRTYDANYAVTDVVSPALNLHFARDAMGNITALGNASGASPATETYTYDPLYRFTGLYDASNNPEETYTYSKTGDRLSKTGNGLATGAYTYQTGTHHLTAIGNAARTYDANGNTTGSVIGGDTFGYGYNGRNRMAVVQRDGSTVGTYTYNGLGQRTAKVVTFPAASSQRFAYDEASQLLGEYGNTSRDYVWLGDLPVAAIDTASGVSTVNYVHADGLNTPRVVANSAGNTIWHLAYQTNAFGEQQPTSANGFVYGLRFPGQYYDVESGLAYNVNRDYEAATGRYIQSDPLGLDGGMSTYGYALGNPIIYNDPMGLLVPPAAGTPLDLALKRAAIVDAAGGGPEDLVGDVVAVGVLGYTLADEIARGANQQEVHNVCDEPPPPNLNDCDLAKWKLTKALRCKLVRQRMADKWFGGTFDAGHATRMSQIESEIARLRNEVDRKCKPCP